MRNRNNILKIITILVTVLVGLYVLTALFFCLPIPRGSKINSKYYTYYKNIFGIYYISVEHSPILITHGEWGYLKDADMETFRILDKSWAKDSNHVWYGSVLITNVDAKTFKINASGIPLDKNNVYIFNYDNSNTIIKPAKSHIDKETVEYFIYRLGERQDEWMRDKDYVYFNDKRINVDRNSFDIVDEDWFTDKNYIYKTTHNIKTKEWELTCIDTRQSPIKPGYNYFRNGRNIIYCDSVIIKDTNIKRFEEIGLNKYIINNTIYSDGKPYLKDSINVEEAKIYFYGHIIADSKRVFYKRNELKEIDAASFKQIDINTYEDEDYIYTITDQSWDKDYPFEKKKK